jgi:CrcB protein
LQNEVVRCHGLNLEENPERRPLSGLLRLTNGVLIVRRSFEERTIMTYLWVAIGSALGGIARYGLTRLTLSVSETFPWGTISVNVIGCFIMGFVGTLALSSGRLAIPEGVRLFLMVGICGGFTTFSSFSLDTFAMVRTGDWFKAAAIVTLSVGLCFFSVEFGHMLAGQSAARAPLFTKLASGRSQAHR